MKRYIKGSINRIEIEIVMVMEYSDSIAAANRPVIEYRDLSFDHQLTSAQLEDYRNFIRSAVSIIYNFGFDVVDEYQSNKSYSYYIQFTPQPYKGFEDELLELDVKFRLSDHYQESNNTTDQSTNTLSNASGTIFKSFVVEGVRHTDIAETLLHIKNICKDLKVGDYSKLS